MSKLKAHLDNIALSHSVFALPFAYMGAFLAAGGFPSAHDLLWVTLAMIGARSAALALNNYIDLKYDRQHPRFTKRPMVTGAVKTWEAALLIIVCLLVFLLAASQLQPLCLKLWPLALIPLVVYPYMKRFSWTCHLVLGVALAAAPVGAWIAVAGEVSYAVLFLGLSVGVWIAAFDVIYGCQDVAFDKTHGLHSMAVRFGVDGALKLSKYMHGISIFGFMIVGVLLNLHFIYYIGVALAAIVLIYQHSIVSPDDLRQVTQRYFMRNGLVSTLLFIFTVISLYMVR
ncbi:MULTISPECIES: UbiA-like polyprenyltransferase [Sporomusa]|uniref:4-hydroxybenzoate octaprenyltransferase n=1 Tax=Sporomusa sphaeroides DSM 2875 TaxID=1337886 RepID=A0ABM9W741_9FIRM|nr:MULTISPECIES: UbiA-like polyprenyltransferase [Sporomusa]MCM0760702.1 putative 4-hydroxybenzoate polyprenyltransferase [Sporomusa sphaeroides DSM 2875]OLS57816.1 4-hydroxybenzoate octaprenyltransferase [Sporomusa sphaeroides DSM 2875]CVK20969.1 4-hydroxybenzoate octaprenyltransferase [Sporomusa sphaeroides DSM 2875]HML34825.1 UbiA-like polyprenyltransferase [Sporomusa sphaeroides]